MKQKNILRLTIMSLFVLSGLFAFSSNTNFVHADSSASTDTEVALNVDSVINISAPSTATINCTPGATAAAAQLCTTVASIGVGTNNITGYTLQMNATNGSPTALTNSAASPAATIPTLSQAYSSSNFPINYWGYTGGLDKSSETGGYNCASNYCPVLAYESTSSNYAPNHIIKATNTPATTSNTDITFGAKVDISKPSGTYSTSVTFTAVTNYVPHPITNGMSMTDIDANTCSDTPEDVTYTVVDPRDQTNYTVAKLRDGNCWMTQNLELGEYGTPMNLTNTLSNVSPSGYTLDFDDAAASTYKGNSNKYGNYYTWPQAVADSSTNVDGEDAPYDICPKGWRLPSAGDATTTSEFYIMLNYYITTGSWNGVGWTSITLSQITDSPISIVFSGDDAGGSLGNQDVVGYYWSSTLSRYHSNIEFDSINVFTTSTYNIATPRTTLAAIYGSSVRCLVPGA